MENEQAKKRFLTKVGVISVMALILVFWFLNAKNIFKFGYQSENTDAGTVELEEIREEFSKAIDKINSDLDEIRNNEDIKKLADKELLNAIILETGAIVSSTKDVLGDKATTSVGSDLNSSIIKDKSAAPDNCPAYINCMPTIGQAPNCQIPTGCEGITQIAY